MLLILCVAFILSGAAGLVYESIWTRYLGQFVGHSAYAQVLVLIIFLGGMSGGAFLIGRRSERVRQPLLWYAIVELAVGVIGLVFHDVFVWTTRNAYDAVFPWLGPGVAHSLAKWTIAALLILPQSILLGATFPLMTAGALRRVPGRAGRTIALLYFANSLGAAGGVLVAGFALIQLAGLPGTLAAAAMINLTVAAAVFLLSRRSESDDVADRSVVRNDAEDSRLHTTAERIGSSSPAVVVSEYSEGEPSHRLTTLLLTVSFGTAVSSFIYEIGWIRMLSLVLGSATHSFELMLSAFILGLASGAFAIRRQTHAGANALRTLAYVQLAMGALAVATLPLYMRSFSWMADFMSAFTASPSGYRAFSLSRYVICLVVMLPATFCAGMTLPLITRLLLRGRNAERAIGIVYGVNTLGSIVGVSLAALVLLPMMGLKWLLIAGAAIDVVLGLTLMLWDGGLVRWRADRRVLWPALAGVGVMFVLGARAQFDQGVLTSGVFRYGRTRAPGTASMAFYSDGRTATVSVRRLTSTGGFSLSTNGKPDASLGPEWFKPPADPGQFNYDASTQVLLPLILLAHAPHARVAAVIGQGSGMSSHTLLGAPMLAKVVTIEIEPEMLRASRLFYPANKRVFDDSRSVFAIDDARSYFASQNDRYDLILSEPSTPWVAGVSGLFTSEFYAHARHFLTPDGVFGQWLHLSEISDGLVLSVVRAVADNFPSYTIYAVGNRDILIVATNKPALAPPDWSVFRLPPIAQDLRRVYPLTPPLLNALHMVDSPTLAPLVAGGGANSDFFPTLDLGAERTRYMNEGAVGFIGLVSDRFALGPILEGRRAAVDGERYTAIKFVPRLEAMELAARQRDHRFDGASPEMLASAERARAIELIVSTNTAPLDWHVWVSAVREAEEMRSGGTAGLADTAFFARLNRYLEAQHAPAAASSSVSFIHGMAAWNFAEASAAADVLIPLALKGDFWIPTDELREATVVARLKLGDVAGARRALDDLAPHTLRDVNDVRPQLLRAWVTAGEADVARSRKPGGRPTR